MESDRSTVTVVVGSLAVIGVSGIVCASALLWVGVEPSAVAIVSSLAAPAIGGLTAILTNTATRQSQEP